MKMTDAMMEDFMTGFVSEMHRLVPDYDAAEDAASGWPWLAPWLWIEEEQYFAEGFSGEELGREWAKGNAEEIAGLVAEEIAEKGAAEANGWMEG